MGLLVSITLDDHHLIPEAQSLIRPSERLEHVCLLASVCDLCVEKFLEIRLVELAPGRVARS